MTDSDKIQLILEKASIMEEAMKLLLVNDVLIDAESLTEQDKKDELQQKIDELQKMMEEKDSEINRLQFQLETHKAKMKDLQQLKDEVIQAKIQEIKILKHSVAMKDESIIHLQSQIKKQHMEIESLQQTIDELEEENDYDDDDDYDDVSNEDSEYIEEAKEMGAYRIHAAFRLPSGFCEHANGRVWRIISLHGDVVTLRRSQSNSSHRYEEDFYIQDILKYYEPI